MSLLGPTGPAVGSFRSARNDASLAVHEAAVIFQLMTQQQRAEFKQCDETG